MVLNFFSYLLIENIYNYLNAYIRKLIILIDLINIVINVKLS